MRSSHVLFILMYLYIMIKIIITLNVPLLVAMIVIELMQTPRVFSEVFMNIPIKVLREYLT